MGGRIVLGEAPVSISEQDLPEREQVGPSVEAAVDPELRVLLLGRHVERRPREQRELAQLDRDREPIRGRHGPDPEVGDLRLAVLVEEDVRGLHVPVDDARLVREGERSEHGGRDRADALDGETPARACIEEVVEAPLLAVLEHHVGDRRVELDVLDADDRGVLESRRELGFAEEPVAHLAPRDLERDLAPDLLVLREVDDGLPPGSQDGEDLVVPRHVARGEREGALRLEEGPRELARPLSYRGGCLRRDRLEQLAHGLVANTQERSSPMSSCACLRRAATVFRSRLTASATSAWVRPPS